MSPRLRQVAFGLGLAVVYFLAARLSFVWDPLPGWATVIWLPTGIALAALLLLGNHLAAGVFLGSFTASLVTGAPAAVAFGIAVGNTAEAFIGASLLRRVPGFSIT